ncbi:hypothetical protein [Mycolicibacter arupensis]|jgi:uncharacterized protein YerC|uniref:Uncharacterized protein n=1 Tax=Mycolicibacter arupensis TaxID=342002 RepID=A0A5C7Y248_9MYCO|nr:hypothetical protein [Mycolicibacter arupensis]TXI55646.1 MAG: hypothetical protein E6Q54_12225 [Mycolicibacter arupensis]
MARTPVEVSATPESRRLVQALVKATARAHQLRERGIEVAAERAQLVAQLKAHGYPARVIAAETGLGLATVNQLARAAQGT